MGAWGHKPFDNDSALDWLDQIEKPMVSVIVAALRKVKSNKRGDGYHEGIAAAALLLDHCRKGHQPDLSYQAVRQGVFAWALLAVETIQKDAEWIAEWKSPEAVERELRSLHRALVARHTIEKKRQDKISIRIIRPKRKRAA